MTASGILVVDKPRGPTSHDVVARLRRLLGTRAVGHAGTLDPMASGVLVILVREATKLSPYLTLEEKRYRATVTFGRSTTTLDAEGDVVEEAPVPPRSLEESAVRAALDAEMARTEQVPPAFSAISVGGARAHRLSRRGHTVDLPPRPVQVRALSLVRCGAADVTVELTVSKGYYVRSFARDLGERLSLPAHLSELRRIASGPYELADAVPFPPESPPPLLPLVDAARRALPVSTLTAEGFTRAVQGKPLGAEHFAESPADGPSAWLTQDGRLVAVGSRAPSETDTYRVRRGFRADE